MLRAQLDRVSIKVDASLQEQYRASNLFGPAVPDSCSAIVPTGPLLGAGTLVTPIQLLSFDGQNLGNPTAGQCATSRGRYLPSDQVQTAGIGLLNLSAGLQVPIFTGFRVTANVQRAKLLRDAAELNIRGTERGVALDILHSYWAVRRAELQRDVSKKAIERFDEAVRVAGARVRAGLAPPVDVNRLETRRQREIARLADLTGAAAEARAQLAVQLGLGSEELDLSEVAEVPTPPPADPGEADRLFSTAVKDRPELLIARRQTLAGRETVRIARSSYYPQLSGTALLQFGNNPYNPLIGVRDINGDKNPFDNTSGSVFIGASLSVNLFDTLSTYTSVRDAGYEVARLKQEERRLGRLVEADVRVSLAHLHRLYDSRDPLVKTLELARDTLDIVERRYKNGDALVLDLIDAQVELLNAEIELANSAAFIAQSWGDLEAATGRVPGARNAGAPITTRDTP